MSEMVNQGRGGMRRSVKVVLIVSLALNMLVLGMVGGMMYHGGPITKAMSAQMTAYGPLTRALSREDRAMIGQTMRSELGDARQSRQKRAAGIKALKTALMADDYNSDTVHQLIVELQDIGLKRYTLGQRLLHERLDTMNDEERRAFANRLEERHR